MANLYTERPLKKVRKTKIYRPARPLPEELHDHVTILLEEQLFQPALTLLTNALTACTATSTPAQIAHSVHVRLAATLAVHPRFTSRTTDSERHTAADEAILYLRTLNQLVGAKNADFGRSLVFSTAAGSSSSSSRDLRTRRKVVGSGLSTPSLEDRRSGKAEGGEGDFVRSSLAGSEALWSCAKDFWHVVGWAFNCSGLYPARWERWRVWLEWMMEVLEDDLDERIAKTEETEKEVKEVKEDCGESEDVQPGVSGSLIAHFVTQVGEGRNQRRRMMRAIFADGEPKAVAEFPEIWRHETKAPKPKRDERAAKRRKLDLENGEFGDYFDDDSEPEDSAHGSARRSRSATAATSRSRSRAASTEFTQGEDDFEAEDGEEESNDSNTNSQLTDTVSTNTAALSLRRRLLSLLTDLSTHPSSPNDLETETLLDLFTEFLRPMPLPIFQAFVLSCSPYLPTPIHHANLSQMLLRPLLSGSAPRYNPQGLDQSDFADSLAPYAANRAEATENAKVSLCLEGLIEFLHNAGRLEATGSLVERVEKGIRTRRGKVEGNGRRKTGARARVDEEALRVLDASAERISALIDEGLTDLAFKDYERSEGLLNV